MKTKRKKCMITTGTMSDPYTPPEQELHFTRRAPELIERYGFGVTLQTKSDLVLRDLDVLSAISEKTKAVVEMTLTTADDALCRIVEPNVCPTSARAAALKQLREAGVPTVVWLCPLLPYINDTPENVSGILKACREAGVKGVVNFGMGLTLRDGDREYYYAALDRHFPGLKERYIREFGNAYEISGSNSRELTALFHNTCEDYGLLHDNSRIFRWLGTFEEKDSQISLF